MHPILFKLGPLTIHTYGVMIAAGFLAGMYLAMREARRQGISPDMIMDLGLYILAAAIVGSRLMQVFVEHRYYLGHPLEIFMIWRGGLVFYGGFIMAVFVSIWYLRRHNLPVWKVGDILAPSLALGHAVGRVGCFTAGCCYGRPTDLPWAVTFSDPDCLAITGVPVHPSQLYESIAVLGLFGFLYAYRNRTAFDGQLFWTYALGYSVIRFMLEFLRGDVNRGFTELGGFHVSTSQAIGLATLVTSVVMLSRLKAAARKKQKA